MNELRLPTYLGILNFLNLLNLLNFLNFLNRLNHFNLFNLFDFFRPCSFFELLQLLRLSGAALNVV